MLQLGPTPENGTAKGEFFHRNENPFQSLDAAHPPTIEEADDELETAVHPPSPPGTEQRLKTRTCNSKL